MNTITELGYGLPSTAQLTAARSYLGWSQEALAARAGVGLATIKRVERANEIGRVVETLKLSTLRAILKAYEDEGVTFARQGDDEILIFSPQAQEAAKSAVPTARARRTKDN